MHVYQEVTVISCLENKYFPPVISSRLGSLKEILQFFPAQDKSTRSSLYIDCSVIALHVTLWGLVDV